MPQSSRGEPINIDFFYIGTRVYVAFGRWANDELEFQFPNVWNEFFVPISRPQKLGTQFVILILIDSISKPCHQVEDARCVVSLPCSDLPIFSSNDHNSLLMTTISSNDHGDQPDRATH